MTQATGGMAAGRHSSLDELPLQQSAHVLGVQAPPDIPEWAQWLTEIGFLPGERVQLLARGQPGDEPLVVRIGDSTFALRRAEARCVLIEPDDTRGAA